MRSVPLGLTRISVAVLLGATGACVSATPGSSRFFESTVPGLASLPAPERQQAVDSLRAEMIADQDGPRIRVSANFQNYAGSRRVEATIRAEDDAYILVGHIGADGRMRIVFPTSPDDDGFVRGGQSYRVPSFFAGFTDEFSQRRSFDYTRLSMIRSRRDSYDAGTGYVFVIASWRPMHFERVADGRSWSMYELSEREYLTDPREAVDELAAVVAGDNREAYTVEYAHYTSTNYGMFASNSYDRCSFASAGTSFGLGLGGFGYGGYGYTFFGRPYMSRGAGPLSLLASWPAYGSFGSSFIYQAFYDPATGCYQYEPVMIRPIFVAQNPFAKPPVPTPSGPRLVPPDSATIPHVTGHRKIDDGTQPANKTPRAIAAGEAADVHGSQAEYRRRGLVVEPDANDLQPSSPRAGRQPGNGIAAPRPTIEQMIQRHETPGDVWSRPGITRRMSDPTVADQPARPRFEAPRSSQPRAETPRAETPRPETPRESQPRHQSPRSEPARSEPAHVEPVRSAPAHVEPVRAAPPPPPSTGTGKPDHH